MGKGHPYWRVVLFLIALTVKSAAASDLYFSSESFAYSEPVPINSLLNDWHGEFSGGSDAVLFHKAEVGFRYDGWSLGLLHRFDYVFHGSEEGVEFYYKTQNQLPLIANHDYPIDVEVSHFEVAGLKFGKEWQLRDDITFTFSLSWLKGVSLREGELFGNATTGSSTTDYDISLFVEDYYSEGDLFNRANVKPYGRPDGKGYAVDIGVKWKVSDRFKIEAEVTDLLGKLWWDQAPYTKADINPVAKVYDSQGYVHYTPALSGIEGFTDYQQKLPWRMQADAEYDWTDDVSITGHWLHTNYLDLVDVGARWRPGSSLVYSAGYGLKTKALMLGLHGKFGGIALASDSLDFNQAHAFTMNAWLQIKL